MFLCSRRIASESLFRTNKMSLYLEVPGQLESELPILSPPLPLTRLIINRSPRVSCGAKWQRLRKSMRVCVSTEPFGTSHILIPR